MSKMRRISGISILAVFLLATFGAVGASAQVARQTNTAADPLAELSSCVSSGGALHALFLIDTSGSLGGPGGTDPTNQRVVAAQAALSSLAALGSAGSITPEKPVVEVKLAEFSENYGTVTEWQPLNNQTLSGIQQSADGFADLNNGLDTDFTSAIIGARDDLAEHAKASSRPDGPRPCQVLMLFTDGKYDIENRVGDFAARADETKVWAPTLPLGRGDNFKEAMRVGRDDLCLPNGEVDVMRVQGVTTIVIALSLKIEEKDQNWIRSLAEGSAGTENCGDPAKARGAYLAADDLGALIGVFNTTANTIAGGTTIPGAESVTVCPLEPCDAGSRTFTADPVMSRISVLADFGKTPGTLDVNAPGQAVVQITTATPTTTIGSAKVTTQFLNSTVASVNISFPAGTTDWQGEWKLSLHSQTGGGAGRLQLFAYTDLKSEFVGEPDFGFELGKPSTIGFKVASSNGGSVDTQLGRSTKSISASVIDPNSGNSINIPLTTSGTNEWSGEWTTPEDWRTSATNLSSELAITTAGGLKLAPVQTRTAVEIKKPASYPQLVTTRLDMGDVEGKGTASGSIEVIGGDVDGSISLANPTLEIKPREFDDVSLKWVDVDKIPVPAGKTVEIQVSYKLSKSADGLVAGVIPATLESSDRLDRPLNTDIAFGFTTKYSVSGSKQFGYFLILLIAAILIPLTLMWIANWKDARFTDRDGLRALRLPVIVHADGSISRRGPDGAAAGPLQASPDEWMNVGDAGRLRTFDWSGYTFKASVPRFPIGDPYGVVIGSAPCIGSAGTHKRGAKVALTLVNDWVFSLHGESMAPSTPTESPEWGAAAESDTASANTPDVTGEILIFAMSGSEEGRLERLAVDQSAGVANLAQGLAEKIRKAKPDTAPASDAVRSPEYASSAGGDYDAGVNLDWDKPASGSSSPSDYSTDWSSSSGSPAPTPPASSPPSAPSSPPSDSDYQIPDY
jgi:hypothetical protein